MTVLQITIAVAVVACFVGAYFPLRRLEADNYCRRRIREIAVRRDELLAAIRLAKKAHKEWKPMQGELAVLAREEFGLLADLRRPWFRLPTGKAVRS